MKQKIKIRFYVLALALMLGGAAMAQQPVSYTLKDILGVALENNNNIIKAKYDFDEGQAKTKEVKSAALPQVNINADVSDNVIRQALVFPKMFSDPNAGPDDYAVLRAGMQYSTSVSAQASQQLFNKSVLTGIKAAKVSEDYYSYNIQRTEEQVIQQVATLFYQAASLQAQRTVLEGTLAQTEKNLAITRDRYQNGVARKLDVDRINVNVTNLQTQIRSIDDSFANTVNQLKLAAGLDMNAAIEVNVPLVLDTATYQYDPAITMNDWSWENKIEFKQLSTQLSLYDLERKNFTAGYYPTLSAFANYTYTGQSNDFIFAGGANPLWFDVASVGIKLQIPVFDGLNKSAKVQQSRIRRLKTERDMTFTRRQSNMEYQNALKSFETSYTSYLAQKDNVALANSVYDVTMQNYNEGVSSLTDLLQAEYSKIESQSQLIESLLKVKQAEVALLKSKGEIKNLLN
ncbi:MAG TPA: TolC family protein [Chryseolinea sp.]